MVREAQAARCSRTGVRKEKHTVEIMRDASQEGSALHGYSCLMDLVCRFSATQKDSLSGNAKKFETVPGAVPARFEVER